MIHYKDATPLKGDHRLKALNVTAMFVMALGITAFLASPVMADQVALPVDV